MTTPRYGLRTHKVLVRMRRASPGFRIAKSSTSTSDLRTPRQRVLNLALPGWCSLGIENHSNNRMAPMDIFKPARLGKYVSLICLTVVTLNSRHSGINEHIIAACVTPPANRLDKKRQKIHTHRSSSSTLRPSWPQSRAVKGPSNRQPDAAVLDVTRHPPVGYALPLDGGSFLFEESE